MYFAAALPAFFVWIAECVFRSFLAVAGAESESDRIYKEDVLRCIWKLSPVDGK